MGIPSSSPEAATTSSVRRSASWTCLLPLVSGVDRTKKKRKTSSVEIAHSPMWSEPLRGVSGGGGSGLPSPSSSASSFTATLTRNRRAGFLLLLVGFMFFSLSSLWQFQSSSASASTRHAFPPAKNDHAVVVSGGESTQLVAYYDNPAATKASHHLRRETPAPLVRPDSFGLVMVADLDKYSRDESSKKPLFISYLQHATLKISRSSSSDPRDTDHYSVSFGEKEKFTTTMNEAGRGLELSELTWFNGKLLSFDDRTGIVFRLKNFEGAKPIQAIPEHIIMEGDGVAAKGQKHEWATVKDDELYMGSVGKEFTDNDGNVIGDSNLWVAAMDVHGDVRREDWTSNFARVRDALDCKWPGYVVHEAIEWSAVRRQWFILPRRVSHEAYNDMLDEQKGSNKMVIASEDFSTIQVIDVGSVTPLRGFSSFKFLPRSDDTIIVAIKSVEIEVEQKQTSFVLVFDVHGRVLMPETELPGGHKYEGVAFSHDWSQEKRVD